MTFPVLFVKLYLLPKIGNFILAPTKNIAPIVQRIEHQPSKLVMGVRFSLGAHSLYFKDNMATIFQVIYSVFFLLLFCFLITEFFNVVFRGFAPFISTKRKIIKQIIKALNIKESDVIMELGCGQAGFLSMVREKYPNNKLIGIEYSILPFIIAGIQNALSGAKIEIRKKNIFKTDVGEASIIYCYLNKATMVKLEEKFKSECKSGTQIISFIFPMPNVKARQEITSENGEKIFFYQF